MKVALPPELEEFVNNEIRSGQYQSASDVVREGLRLLRLRREKLAALRQEIQIGLDDIERGDYVDYTSVQDLFEDIEAAVSERPARKPKPRKIAASSSQAHPAPISVLQSAHKLIPEPVNRHD